MGEVSVFELCQSWTPEQVALAEYLIWALVEAKIPPCEPPILVDLGEAFRWPKQDAVACPCQADRGEHQAP